MSVSQKTFLRGYQGFAVGEILKVFAELDPKRLKRGEEIPSDKRITILKSPTASGKTIIMGGVSAELLEQGGFPTIVLTHLSTVANQNKDAGLNSTSIQNLFHAFKAASEQKLRAKNARVFVAERLGFPAQMFEKELCCLIDESHWGAETISKIYNEVLSLLPNIRLIVGFTATPRFKGVFNTIDLTDKVQKYVAPPMGSLIYTHSLLTLPNQLRAFPSPGLVFTQSVASAAIITMVMNILSQKNDCILLAGNGKMSLTGYVERALSSIKSERKKDEIDFDGDNEPETTDDYVQITYSKKLDDLLPKPIIVDSGEKRIGLIALLLTLDTINRLPQDSKYGQFSSLMDKLYGVPNFADSLRLIKTYKPNLYEDFKTALFHKKKSSIEKVMDAVGNVSVHQSNNPSAFIKGPEIFAASVYKIGTGFDYPALRTICMAEGVSDSEVLYRQRSGRGARKIEGKNFYDLIDVIYLDPMSSGGGKGQYINWVNTFIKDPAQRRDIEKQDLVFREPCRPDDIEILDNVPL